MKKTIKVDLGEKSYDIHIGEKCLADLPELLSNVSQESMSLLVSDELVFSLYGEEVLGILHRAGYKVETAVIKGGEGCKNLTMLGWLYEQMITNGLDRSSTVFALGGGVVGDLAGFAAASFMRGAYG